MHVYTMHPQLAVSRGCSVDHWEPEADGRAFDLARLKALVTPATSMVVVNFPHNPTGATLTERELEELAELCHHMGATLFSDEVRSARNGPRAAHPHIVHATLRKKHLSILLYGTPPQMYLFLPHDPAQQLPTAALLTPRAVCLSGMSKCFGMPGIRLGWLVSRDVAFIKAAAQLKDYSTICSPGPSEWLALQALRNAAAVVDVQRRVVLRNLQTLDAFFQRCAGCVK